MELIGRLLIARKCYVDKVVHLLIVDHSSIADDADVVVGHCGLVVTTQERHAFG